LISFIWLTRGSRLGRIAGAGSRFKISFATIRFALTHVIAGLIFGAVLWPSVRQEDWGMPFNRLLAYRKFDPKLINVLDPGRTMAARRICK
jgi:hypothetical protein